MKICILPSLAILVLVSGCCSLFHIDCPQQDYWTTADVLASGLTDRYANTNFYRIVPLPLGDYKLGTTLSKGIGNGFSCVFPASVISNYPADNRLASESNVVSFSLALTSPTNISQFTGSIKVDYTKNVYVSFSHMTLQQVEPKAYRDKIGASSGECVNELKINLRDQPGTMILVGYLVGQFQMSASRNFDIDLKAVAYGANGTVAYTNSGGWTVLATNPVPCFALVSVPKITISTEFGSKPDRQVMSLIDIASERPAQKLRFEFDRPSRGVGLSAVKPANVRAER